MSGWVNLMKLFVITRKDLSPSQMAVQAGHTIAEYLLHSHFSRWKNQTLIYLGVKNLRQLEHLKYKFERDGIEYTEFREPDFNNELTALATDIESKHTERLNLL
jgi:hypothetical protein